MSRPRSDYCQRLLHRLAGDNLYVSPNGDRCCRECKRNARPFPGTRTPTPRPYVQAPLLALIRDLSHVEVGLRYADRHGVTEASGQRIVLRMLAREALTLSEADRISVAMGRHISEIWPEYAEEDELPDPSPEYVEAG